MQEIRYFRDCYSDQKLHGKVSWLLGIFIFIINATVYALPVSPWDDQQPELSTEIVVIPGESPIVYKVSTFTRERELYGYNPRFLPNLVTFDKYNRPYIYVGVHEVAGDNASTYPGRASVTEAYIQRLDADGKWKVYSVFDILKEVHSNWIGGIQSGVFITNERVVFDDDGDLYFIVHCTEPARSLLLHYCDKKSSWQGYEIKPGNWRFELPNLYSNNNAPPPAVSDDGKSGIWLLNPKKTKDGTLTNTEAINLASDPNYLLAPSHSGLGNSVLRSNGKIFAVALSKEHSSDGTNQYFLSYDESTKKSAPPFYLGSTKSGEGNTPDIHNGPVLAIDSDQVIHIVMGSHNRPFKIRQSSDFGKSWSETQEIGNNETQGQTYTGYVIDKNNTQHLVARMIDPQRRLSLHYMRKKTTDKTWQDMGKLIVPNRTEYSGYYHKLTIDRSGRLYLAYFYFAHALDENERKEYIQKWPNDPDPGLKKRRTSRAHDSVLLMSDDGGDSWIIATTDDFEKGILFKTR